MTVTLEEYAREIAGELQRAHDNKDLSAVSSIFSDADKALAANTISEADQKSFWTSVRKVFQSSDLLLERQSNSALIALMQAIQRGIAERMNK
jgi:hypothetical protein